MYIPSLKVQQKNQIKWFKNVTYVTKGRFYLKENILLFGSLLLGVSILAGIDKSHMIFNLVFFISLTSVLLQGTTFGLVSKWLHVTFPEKAKQRTPPDNELSDTMKSELTEIEIDDRSPAVGERILELGFPRAAMIALIKRKAVDV